MTNAMAAGAQAPNGSPTERCEVQRTCHVKEQAGECPFLEPLKSRNKNGDHAERLGGAQERQQVSWIAEMSEDGDRSIDLQDVWNRG